MENNGSLWKLEEKTQGLEESHVGAVVLASVYLVLGVVAFFCVFYVQRKKLGGLSCSTHDRPKSLRNVHSFLIALLTVDFLHVIVTISVLILFMTDTRDFVRSIGLNVWLASVHFMVFLHLITALTSICYLCTPPSKGRLPPWCMAPVMVLCLLALSALYSDYILYVETALGFFVIALVLSIIFRNCCSRESHLVTVWRIPIVLVAVISVCVCFFPSIIFHYLFLLSSKVSVSFYLYFQFGTNIQLLLDALLCSFILNLPVKEEQPAPQTNYDSPVSLPETHSRLPELKHQDFQISH